MEIFQGWNAYAKWANTLGLRRKVVKRIYSIQNGLNILSCSSEDGIKKRG